MLRLRLIRQLEEFLEPSDEEVLGGDLNEDDIDVDESDEDDDDGVSGAYPEVDGNEGSVAEEAEEPGEGLADWGPSKRDYYDADVIETEQDALDEEAEALRIQQKQLQAMSEADFAFDEGTWAGEEEDGDVDGERDIVTEVLPQLQITDGMGALERRKLLNTRYPEFEPLANEYLELQRLRKGIKEGAADVAQDIYDGGSVRRAKNNTITAYVAAMAMYLVLLTSTADDQEPGKLAMQPSELREHAVMESILHLRELWNTVKDLEDSEDDSDHEGTSDEEAKSAESYRNIGIIESVFDKAVAVKGRKEKKSKTQRALEAAQARAEAQRAEKLRKKEQELANLSTLIGHASRTEPSKKRPVAFRNPALNEDDSDFGDETELTPQELAEKASRKKGLRFYTSQIAQRANKQSETGKYAGGDADVPYKERFRERQLRLNALAEKKAKMAPDIADEMEAGSEEEDARVAREVRGDAGDEDEDYYDMVASASKQKKQDKLEKVAALALAEREGGRVVEQEEIGPDGKRAVSYKILKNKGLTPKRNKASRNPRVKKKLKYEDKMKKLGSQRQLYKGGEGRGGYGGEATGIKSSLVKSRKLG